MIGLDDRKGLPSASSMERLSMCPGSHRASIGIPEETSEWAESGSRIHAIIAGEDVLNVTYEERQTARICDDAADEYMRNHLWGIDLENSSPVIREERWWDKTNQYSGKADLVLKNKDNAFIIDFKTGRGEVESASSNMQLRTLAVLAKEKWPNLKLVNVVIIQPLARKTSDDCVYDETELLAAKKEIVDVLDAASKPDAPRLKGESQCKYCPARTRCPEALSQVAMPKVEEMGLPQLSAQELGKVLDKCSIAEQLIDAIREEARTRLDKGETVEGWKLKRGAMRESISDPFKLMIKYIECGGEVSTFLKSVTVSKSKLAVQVQPLAEAKGMEIEKTMSSLLEGCTEMKQNASSLSKSK